jgi:hypothetical protein
MNDLANMTARWDCIGLLVFFVRLGFSYQFD